tara:strand:+ start:241 stop:741 length:501 start_codon:yes stop_codon:yes gene_type:complete
MNKIISLPLLLLVLNFNAQKDFISKYDLRTFVSDNYELIENLNPKKINDRIEFKMKLLQHRLKNNGIIENSLFKFRLVNELKKTMSDNKNYVKIKNRALISGGILTIYVTGILVYAATDPISAVYAAAFLLLPVLVLSVIPLIEVIKNRTQLHKDYFLSISSDNTN